MLYSFLIVFLLQPFFNYPFLFLPLVLKDFFSNKVRSLNIELLIFTLFYDLLFIKPIGFFLTITVFSLLAIALLEKFLDNEYFYQIFIFLLIFNSVFLFLYFYFSGLRVFNLYLIVKFLTINLVYQLIYFFLKGHK